MSNGRLRRFFFSSRRRHTRWTGDWSSDVCSSDLVERSGLVAPKLSDAPLPDVRGDLCNLAIDLHRAGIHNLAFAAKFHVGELDTLAQLAKAALLESGQPTKREALAWWPAKLLENRVEGIAVNTQTERKVDTVLASLMA